MNPMLIRIVKEVLLHLRHEKIVRILHRIHRKLREAHHLLILLVRLEEVPLILLPLIHVIAHRVPSKSRIRTSRVNLRVLAQSEHSIQKPPRNLAVVELLA